MTTARTGAGRVRGEQDLFWRVADRIVRFAFHLLFRIRWLGTEHIPREGAALLAANHISPLDPIFIALAPSWLGRTMRFLAAAEFFDKPVVGTFLSRLHQIPIRRGASDWRALEEVADVVRAGSLAGIFPEGRIGDGVALAPGHRGAARLALAAGVPIIPVGVWGTQRRWPRSGLRLGRPLRPTIAVVFGPAISADGDPRDRQDARDLTALTMSAIAIQVDRARTV
jgi:1-acyl-sn-glycerol-3-phosphate acyltransferase